MTKPETRSGLAKLIPAGSTMVELGVAAGKFAVQLIEANPQAHYIGIDRWGDHHDYDEMAKATERIMSAGDNANIMRASFDVALPTFDDESIDLIYFDGYAHTGQEGGKTLEDWLPKVKKGGVISGHDYHPEYQPTIDAVNLFVERHGFDLQIIDEKPYPSWFCYKK